MPLFEADEQTQAIVIYTEPGGRMEAELARYVTEESARELPIVAFMAGHFMDEMPGISSGTPARSSRARRTAAEKIERLRDRRHVVAEEIAEIGPREGTAGGGGVRARRDGASSASVSRWRPWPATPSSREKLEEACPVDIYAAAEGGVEIVARTWTRRPLRALPGRLASGAVKVLKLYDGGAVLEPRPDFPKSDLSRRAHPGRPRRRAFWATSASRWCASRTTRSRAASRSTAATSTPGGYVHGGVWVAFADTVAAWGTFRHSSRAGLH